VARHGHKPVVNYVRVFGCLTFVKELNNVGKLNDHSSPGVFIGYAEGAKAYRVLDLVTRCVRVAHNVVFDEGRGWAWDKATDDGTAVALHDFTIEYTWAAGVGGASSASSPSAPPRSPSPNSGEVESSSVAVQTTPAIYPTT
jgi:hypothetical protein